MIVGILGCCWPTKLEDKISVPWPLFNRSPLAQVGTKGAIKAVVHIEVRQADSCSGSDSLNMDETQ